MIQDWQLEEKDEHISQGVLLLSKLLLYPDDCELRARCESWITEHKSYLNEADILERTFVKTPIEDIPEDSGYDISKIDSNNLGF